MALFLHARCAFEIGNEDLTDPQLDRTASTSSKSLAREEHRLCSRTCLFPNPWRGKVDNPYSPPSAMPVRLFTTHTDISRQRGSCAHNDQVLPLDFQLGRIEFLKSVGAKQLTVARLATGHCPNVSAIAETARVVCDAVESK